VRGRYALLLSRDRGKVLQRVRFLLTVLLAIVLLAGCGGQEDTSVEQQEKEAGVEELAPEAPVESLPSYDTGPDTDAETCQVERVIADLGPEGAQRLTGELLEAVRTGQFANMQEAYAARGYTCNESVK
jgi:PBP1b-binding outer membrane lipoprotein LpoB